MKRWLFMGAVSLLALHASQASAQLFGSSSDNELAMPRGLYLGLQGGLGWSEDNKFQRNGTDGTKAKYDAGPVGSFNMGYGFPFGLRLELEAGYKQYGVDTINGLDGDGKLQIGSLMANAIYDVPLPTFGIPVTPHIGLGAGYARPWNHSAPHNGLLVNGHDNNLAVQAIAGIDYVFSPNFVVGLDYKYFRMHDVDFRVEGTGGATSHVGDVGSHNFLLGFRYYFGAPPPKPQPAAYAPPPPPPVTQPQAAPAMPPAPVPKTYSVFFDFDRSDVDPSARPVIAEAASNAKRGNVTRIQVTGHADRSGSDRYNQRLSERRAAAVRQELIRQGVPADEIVTIGRGESEPAVPTPDGVREPRNRRVEIVMQSPGA